MTRRSRRGRPSRQEGFTLLEMIVTIALVAVGVVGVTYAIASAQRIAAINQKQAQLESAMRQVSDYVRDSNTSTGLPYMLCASSGTYNSLLGTLADRPTKPSGLDWTIVSVYESTTGTRNGVATAPIRTIGCPAGDGDWGVQEISIKVCMPSCAAATETLSRTVWKADA